MFLYRVIRRFLMYNVPLPFLIFVCIIGVFSIIRLSEVSVSIQSIYTFYTNISYGSILKDLNVSLKNDKRLNEQ